jgi:hypothetical protein
MGDEAESIGTGIGSIVVETVMAGVRRGTEIVFVCEGMGIETGREMDPGESIAAVVTGS